MLFLLFFEIFDPNFGTLGMGIAKIGLQIRTWRPRTRLYGNLYKFGSIISFKIKKMSILDSSVTFCVIKTLRSIHQFNIQLKLYKDQTHYLTKQGVLKYKYTPSIFINFWFEINFFKKNVLPNNRQNSASPWDL